MIAGLHHIHLRVPDPAATRAFATDFGLHEAAAEGGRHYLRGAGTGAYQLVIEAGETSALLGLAFAVDGPDDLRRAVAAYGATAVRRLDGFGGGEAVTLTDPDGTKIDLVHGIEAREHDPVPPPMIFNHGGERTRQGAAQYNAPVGAPHLLRLGHVGLFVRDFAASARWYQDKLGLLPSDVMYADRADNLVAGFYRIDRGEEWVDHHTIAFFGFGKSDLHHLSFEVSHSEAQFAAHRWLTRQGHRSVWGVGRHPKGSHVFDVWRDPSGYRFETFSDTDVATAAAPGEVHDITTMEMDLWSDRSFHAYFE